MRKKLNKKLCMDDIYEICILTHGNNRKKAHLYQLTFDEDERISTNALWVFTHFDIQNNEWLYAKHDDLIDRVLVEKNETKRRLMLQLLLRQPFEEESLRSDFIDFCIAHLYIQIAERHTLHVFPFFIRFFFISSKKIAF